MPRVLSCFHIYCLSCLEKMCDGGDRVSCPQCQVVTPVPPSLLIPDYALHRLLETPIDQPASCTACKSRDVAAVARCLDCSKLLCPHCVMAHQFMHCFEGHRVVTLAELAQRDVRPVTCVRHKGEPLKYFCLTCSVPVCMDCTLLDHPKGMHEYEPIQDAAPRHIDQISHAMEDGRNRAADLRACIKAVENSSSRLQEHYDKAQSEIQEAFTFYSAMVEERKAELMRELDSLYHAKQVSLSLFAQKAQDCIDRLLSTCGFVDKMRKYANSTELLMFRKLIEAKLSELMSKNFDLGMQNVSDLEFVSNFSAIQVGVRNTFGYIRSSSDIQVGPTKLPPIARPNNNSTSVSSMNNINSCLNGLSGLNSISNSLSSAITNGVISNGTTLPNTLTNGLTSSLSHTISNGVSSTLTNGLSNGGLTNGLTSAINGTIGSSMNGILERPFSSSHLSSLLTKRFGNSQSLGPFSTSPNLSDLNLNGINGYEKWSSGEGSVFNHESLNQTDPILHDLSSKLLSCSIFPPRSQIKRQKMIYHCKFGEFGVLEGQFTEPSGVAVNAQNDIIVADTNNHRIQIFDKEGRFKFQFGECGKRDSQLLYPNRVAVVRTSGDIIVTERSPTHQIQIYNQYGQFVRKFGANTLCYPRGVTVDNKGRIIVVECKVMRVIIFDQYGTVLHQFNCPNHLEFPNGVVVNDKQEIFISDNRAHCVKVCSISCICFRNNFFARIIFIITSHCFLPIKNTKEVIKIFSFNIKM